MPGIANGVVGSAATAGRGGEQRVRQLGSGGAAAASVHDLTAEQEREVQEAIFRRLPDGFSCPLCHGREFTLLARSVVLPERGD